MRELNLDFTSIKARHAPSWCEIVIEHKGQEFTINLWGNPGACEALTHAINTEFHPIPETSDIHSEQERSSAGYGSGDGNWR